MLRGQLDDAHGPGLGKFAIPSCLTVRVPAGRANRTQGGLLRRNPFPPAEPSLLTAPGVGGQRRWHRHRAACTPAPRKSCGRFHSTNERVQLRQVLRGRVWARKVALNKFHRRGTAEDLAAHDTQEHGEAPGIPALVLVWYWYTSTGFSERGSREVRDPFLLLA